MEDGEFLKGLVPASELGDYAQTLAAYTQGRGHLQISVHGYLPCHNADAVIADAAYDPEADLENTPDSVFCAHGAGFTVKWDQVKAHMHLESGLKEEKEPQILTRNLRYDDMDLEKIMEREFGPIKRPQYREANRPATETLTIRPPANCSIVAVTPVDGLFTMYNIPEQLEIRKEEDGFGVKYVAEHLNGGITVVMGNQQEEYFPPKPFYCGL